MVCPPFVNVKVIPYDKVQVCERLLVRFLVGILFVRCSVLNVFSKRIVLCWEDVFVKIYKRVQTNGSRKNF